MLGAGLQQARGLAAVAGARRARATARRASCAWPRRRRSARCAAALKLRWAERRGAPAFVAALARVAEACERRGRGARHGERARARLRPPARARAPPRRARGRVRASGRAPGRSAGSTCSPHQARLVESPLDIRDALREQMAQRAPRPGSSRRRRSATTIACRWFTEPAGLEDARIVLRVGSPFDYAEHARVCTCRARSRSRASPATPTRSRALAARCARALGGRTFVLTTTLRSLQAVGAHLRAAFDADGDEIEVLVQGQGSKRQLMQRFLDAPRAVLVGSQSFWEGIDVPGEALQCVHHRQAAVPAAQRSAGRGARQAAGSRGPQRLRRLLRRRGGGVAEAGRRPADPQRDRSRPARRLRSAHGDDGLRAPPVRGAAADDAGRREAEAIAWLRELAGAAVER